MILALYRRLLSRYPFVVEGVQAGIFMGAGDLIAQTAIEKKNFKEIDLQRTTRFFLIGTVFVGPPLRYWYGILQRYMGSSNKVAALKKVAVDQIAFAPIFSGSILSIISYSETFSFEETKLRLMQIYPDVLMNNYKVWPLVQLCNFYLIPLHFQVVVVQIVAVFWNTYLSWKTHSHKHEKE